jgi:hypothetical protein
VFGKRPLELVEDRRDVVDLHVRDAELAGAVLPDDDLVLRVRRLVLVVVRAGFRGAEPAGALVEPVGASHLRHGLADRGLGDVLELHRGAPVVVEAHLPRPSPGFS